MNTKLAENVIQPVVLSIPQAGAYLSVSPDTVRRLIRSGTIPHARIGNSIRIRRADLDGYLDSQISRQWQPVDNRGGGFRVDLGASPRKFCGAGVSPAHSAGTAAPQKGGVNVGQALGCCVLRECHDDSASNPSGEDVGNIRPKP